MGKCISLQFTGMFVKYLHNLNWYFCVGMKGYLIKQVVLFQHVTWVRNNKMYIINFDSNTFHTSASIIVSVIILSGLAFIVSTICRVTFIRSFQPVHERGHSFSQGWLALFNCNCITYGTTVISCVHADGFLHLTIWKYAYMNIYSVFCTAYKSSNDIRF